MVFRLYEVSGEFLADHSGKMPCDNPENHSYTDVHLQNNKQMNTGV